MQSRYSSSELEVSLASQWINWCRLCAKEDNQHNINFLYQNEEEHFGNENKKLSIQEALAKYFWVQTSFEDSLPKVLCTNCLSLVSGMMNFNQRVERVQLMYLHLAESDTNSQFYDLNSVRLKFDVTETERDLWVSKYSLSPPSVRDDKFKVQIKQENGEKLREMEYDKYMEEDADLEQEQMVFDDNANDSLADEDEDPFEHNGKEENCFKTSSSEEEHEETQNDLDSIKSEPHEEHTKFGRPKVKRKRKRKKLKQFNQLEYRKKTKADIKDFEMEISCKECASNFTQYMSYRDHLQQQHGHSLSKKHWQCPSCDRVLLSLFNLERHVHIHQPLESRKTIKCSECDNRYTSNAQLETHVRYKHKNEKPFICEECGLSLRTNSNLRQHMLIHTDIAPFECEVCKKKFKNKTRLKTHMDIHSPNKHICNICGLQLNSRATLNRHFLVHSDEMQHKCDYCGKAFKRAKALKNHLLLHTGLKPYSCDFCERTFANGSNCRSHMKKTHPEELAILEASGNKTHTKNIPKLETLKAVTKAADNLTPVVTKFSGCFAFGKKPKNLENPDTKTAQKTPQKPKKAAATQIDHKKLSTTNSPSSTPLDLQYIPLVGNNTTSPSTCLIDAKNLENIDLNATTQIPNFDNIYQHIMKQTQHQQQQTDLEIKPPLSQISPRVVAGTATSQHNPFFPHTPNDIMLQQQQSIKSSSTHELLNSPESHHSSMTPLTSHDDASNASSIQAAFYGPMRTALPPGSFM